MAPLIAQLNFRERFIGKFYMLLNSVIGIVYHETSNVFTFLCFIVLNGLLLVVFLFLFVYPVNGS